MLSREKRQIVSREKKFLSREPRSSFHVKHTYPTREKYGFVSRESRELVGVVGAQSSAEQLGAPPAG